MYSGLNDPAQWVLPRVLEEMAKTKPTETWITTIEGDSLTFGEAFYDVLHVAGYFASLGVKHGDRVGVFMGNSCDFVRVWLGLGRLGAVAVFLNTELKGTFLTHQLVNSALSLAVVDATLLTVLEAVATDSMGLRAVVLVDGTGTVSTDKFQVHSFAKWRTSSPWEGPMPMARDLACIMYTSGTTGPSKGVLMPHAHCALYGIGEIEALQLGPGDRFYICMPLVHANGLLMQLSATLLAGIPAVVRTRFSASAWLEEVRQYDITVTNLMGTLPAFILAQPPSLRDTDHKLRKMLSAPNLPAHEALFHERLGIRDVISGFGMTEVNIPIWGRLGTSLPGKSGWVYERYFEVRIADPETDELLPSGEQGEIQVRPKLPFGFGAGYFNMPERTVESWRNLWFHTGDSATMTADGVVTYIDRIKDCIRRRGENISATEVESAIEGLPGVAEVAAYPVPSDIPGAEDDLMLAIVPKPGCTVCLHDIGRQAENLLPRFAKPRYLRLVDEMPRTATGKVQRAILRKQGIQNAVDREAAK
ncbi:AMP-binding protein [Rhodoferax sp.]|uniref:AMP-binding protein n=1 Tax=Rhodoferax sp. TaxID=50421 RepID=UPI002618E39C|nr:AMP-binding protein [Rhodoferax sp.]MDD3937593.1 AMP-binding protein [Rhodoferax sp.]